MSNLRKLFGIIFVAAIIVCAMASCDLLGELGGNTTGSNTGGSTEPPSVTPTTPTNPTTVAVTGVSIKSTTGLC